jgi:hypothetical protein
MVVRFTTTYAISAYHHRSCEFEPSSWQGVHDTTLCDKVCEWLVTGRWFSPGTVVSSTNKTDHHDITEILLKVALNTITCNQRCEFELHSSEVYSIQHYVIKVCPWLAACLWVSPDTPVSSTNKMDRHDITEILLKVALNNITLTLCTCTTRVEWVILVYSQFTALRVG